MATLNQRITALEQQTPCEVFTFTAHQLATCTDDELTDIFFASPCPVGGQTHENYLLLLEILENGEGARHGE